MPWDALLFELYDLIFLEHWMSQASAYHGTISLNILLVLSFILTPWSSLIVSICFNIKHATNCLMEDYHVYAYGASVKLS